MMKYKGKRAGVVLAGCGVYDGGEIHEAGLTLLALDAYRQGDKETGKISATDLDLLIFPGGAAKR